MTISNHENPELSFQDDKFSTQVEMVITTSIMKVKIWKLCITTYCVSDSCQHSNHSQGANGKWKRSQAICKKKIKELVENTVDV